MRLERPSFTIGIEEEYFLVDRETRDLVPDMPDSLLRRCEEIVEGQVSPEFIRSQIEVGTPVARNIKELRSYLGSLRKAVAAVAADYGMAIISASTHPFADWGRQRHTDKERYNLLAQALQGVVRRLLICGMHVHVAIEDEDLRIDLMNQVTYFLPHLLALSTSSPFWQGIDTGLRSYRTSVFRSLPRTGLPEEFSGWSDYHRHIDVLVEAGVIEDGTRLWWDIRPSSRYPTLEMRSTDICTNVDDGITLAALFQALLSMLFRRRLENQRWRTYSPMLISENIWRAQRYGISESLIDFGKGILVPVPDLVDEIVELVREDAVELGSLEEVEHAKTIIARGTSADQQLRVYHEALARGADEREALREVVDALIAETVAGL
ncbi:MAG TPA: carboxylate-amine ligase [Actinobacteria bacterium]|nr:carboxylate-amine ligase [Actinomycetota bacterium]